MYSFSMKVLKCSDLELEVQDNWENTAEGWSGVFGQIVRSTSNPARGYLVLGYDFVRDEVIIISDSYDALVSKNGSSSINPPNSQHPQS